MTPVSSGAPPGPNLLDRMVAAISPRAGLERLKARRHYALLGGYDGGRRERRATKLWRPAIGSADADTLSDLPALRARSRELRRNAPIAAGAIATVASNVGALRLKANIDPGPLGVTAERADEMEREHEREFALFARQCDVTRVQHLDDLALLALVSALESGDVFCLRRYRKDAGDVYGTKVQLVEADRVCNPDHASDTDALVAGVERDGDGAPLAYHVTDKHPGALRAGALKWLRVKARSAAGLPLVLHLFDRTRPDLTRGVPYLAPVIEHLKQLSTYAEAEIGAAVMNAMITAFVTANDDDANPAIGSRTEADGSDAGLQIDESKIGAMAMINLAKEESVAFPPPARPNAQFDPFVQAFLRQIGVALELPFELLIKHFTASYSASRAALEMAWQFFRRKRAWLARYFYQPLYEWMLTEAVASGRLDRPGFFDDPILRAAYCGAAWIGPGRPSIDQSKDAEADRAYLDMEITTREEIRIERFGDRGGDWENGVHPQAVKEQRLRERDGVVSAAAPANKPLRANDGGSDLETAPASQGRTG